MTLVHFTATVKEGLLLELPQEAQELHLEPGQEIQIHLDRSPTSEMVRKPNAAGLAALQRIAEMQEGRRHTDGSQTDRILREGRDGAMYGSPVTE